MLELVAYHVENGKPCQSRELGGNLHDVIVTEGE